MTGCKHCVAAIRERLYTFKLKHRVSGCNFLYEHLRSECEFFLPGLFELIQSPQQWIGGDEFPGFPLSPERVARENFHIEVVIAPLPFVAVVVRVVCPQCSRSHRIIHLGANFYVLASHFSAYLAGTGLGTRDFVRLAIELRSTKPEWNRFSAPQALRRDVLTYGMAWIMCHEIGHFASPSATSLPSLDVPDYARAHLVEEANADRMSFSILSHRVHAMPNNQTERFAAILAGVLLMLNTWNLLIPKAWGRQSDISGYGPRVGAITPSPALRWRCVRDTFDGLVSLGVASEMSFQHLREEMFPELTRKMFELQEILDEFPIPT